MWYIYSCRKFMNYGRVVWRLPEPSDTKIWSWVSWDSEPIITLLSRTRNTLLDWTRYSTVHRVGSGIWKKITFIQSVDFTTQSTTGKRTNVHVPIKFPYHQYWSGRPWVFYEHDGYRQSITSRYISIFIFGNRKCILPVIAWIDFKCELLSLVSFSF
jgi:hypothetical protein